MKKGTRVRIGGLLLAGLLSVGAVPPDALAQEPVPLPSEEMGTIDEERAIGVFGAALCGAEGWLIRTNPLIGMHPYFLAAGIGGCLLALMDVATT
jgi:hypothetical protein